ncbi:hypothetical protein E2562_022123 [Oryza meyeriana var. granulata]|uniref:Uncharacterized protein n=1 Tax=Oryza meyeriana var. granulata TaxID=110450 RepID=A0A6G1BMB7_9ORYZ|nr:hypothetical protein E2562_022123 [Oryza meyeriana var. granulata]
MHKLNRGGVEADVVCRTANKIRVLWSWRQIASQIQELKDRVKRVSAIREDYRIDRDELIWRWIAESFIPEVKGQTSNQLTIIYDGTSNSVENGVNVIQKIMDNMSQCGYEAAPRSGPGAAAGRGLVGAGAQGSSNRRPM